MCAFQALNVGAKHLSIYTAIGIPIFTGTPLLFKKFDSYLISTSAPASSKDLTSSPSLLKSHARIEGEIFIELSITNLFIVLNN